MTYDSSKFGCEIDALAVGSGSRSGDAICMRWGNLYGKREEQFVLVIDGGFADTGDAIARHLRNFYHTDEVNLIINTHPHEDHIGGLKTIVEEFKVGGIVMKTPWTYEGLSEYFDDARRTDQSIKKILKEKFNVAKQLYDLAQSKKIAIYNNIFPRMVHCNKVEFYILGPSKDYYNELIPNFKLSPNDQDYKGKSRVEFLGFRKPSISYPLSDRGDTSAENNSSLIFAFRLPGGQILLFTGDAGMPALEKAIIEAKNMNLDIQSNIAFFQLPHHGSIQNIGPTILDKILGKSSQKCDSKTVWVLASASKADENHPAEHVVNAILDRNGKCYSTEGKNIRFPFGSVPNREGWTSSTPKKYNDVVEAFV